MPHKSILPLTFFVSVFILVTSCSMSHKTYSDWDKWIPKDFDPQTTTLLVMEHPYNKKQNRHMVEYLQKYYPYPYEVVTEAQLLSTTGKYADYSKYRFGIRWRKE